MGAARAAAERWAQSDPDAFRHWAKEQEPFDLAPVHRLVAHVFALNPEAYAHDALDYLVGDERRLSLGASDGRATTLRLVSAVAPYWDEAEAQRFESAIAAYDPPPRPDLAGAEERRRWRNSTRRLKLELLRALPKHQRSPAVDKQVEVEGRRFVSRPDIGRFAGAHVIGSIVDAATIARASDDDVVNAFTVLPDATDWSHPSNWDVGGNIQLAREFATFAKGAPERAVRILGRLDAARGTRAAAYALDALAEGADPALVSNLLLSVVRRGFDGEEFRSSASRAIERLSNRNEALGDDVIEVLETWLANPIRADQGAAEDVDTATAAAEGDDKSGSDTVQRSLLWGYGGISILPGGDYPALEALTRARLARKEPDRLLDTLEAFLAHGRDVRTWDNLLRLLYYVNPSDPERRTRFLTVLFDAVPGLTGTKAASQFIANAAWWSLPFVERQLDRWKALPTRVGKQAYGEMVGLIAILQPDVEWARLRLDELIAAADDVDARAGAALSAANLWKERKTRHDATKLLTRVIPLGEPGVWVAAVDIFRLVDALTPDPDTVEFLSCLADNLAAAPQLGSHFIVERIASLLPHHAALVGRIAQALVQLWRDSLSDIRTSHALAGTELTDLAVTLHRLGPETRELGTTLFEELIALDAYGARATIDEIDNRFRTAPSPQRRRLRRASASPPRPRGRRSSA